MTENSVIHIPPSDITSALFIDKLESAFTLTHGELTLPVTLVACTEKPDAAGPDSTRTPFQLTLRADIDESHPLQQAIEFKGGIEGLQRGPIEDLLIHRTLRPVKMPEGAYYQIIFG